MALQLIKMLCVVKLALSADATIDAKVKKANEIIQQTHEESKGSYPPPRGHMKEIDERTKEKVRGLIRENSLIEDVVEALYSDQLEKESKMRHPRGWSIADPIYIEEANPKDKCSMCMEVFVCDMKFKMKNINDNGSENDVFMCIECKKQCIDDYITTTCSSGVQFPIKARKNKLDYGELTVNDLNTSHNASTEAMRRFCLKQLDAPAKAINTHYCDNIVDGQVCNEKISIPDWDVKERQCPKCGDVKALCRASRLSDEQLNEIIMGLARPCPWCFKHVQKGRACNHMRCRTEQGGCGGEFTWTGEETTGFANPEEAASHDNPVANTAQPATISAQPARISAQPARERVERIQNAQQRNDEHACGGCTMM